MPESFGTVWLTLVMCNDRTVIAHEIKRWDIAGFHQFLGARRLAFQFFSRVISVAMALNSKLEPPVNKIAPVAVLLTAALSGQVAPKQDSPKPHNPSTILGMKSSPAMGGCWSGLKCSSLCIRVSRA